MTVPALLTVAWGVLAFGAVHPWAYWPLMWGCVVTAVIGLRAGGDVRGTVTSQVAVGLMALVVAVLLQLVPLAPAALNAVSPSTHTFRQAYDQLPGDAISTATAGALQAHAPGASRPLSLRPQGTLTALALVLALGLLLLGGMSGLRPENARRLAAGLLVIGVAVALVAIVQRATYQGRIYGFWESRFSTNAYGPFVNRNHFAGWMLMTISVGLGYLMALSSRKMPRLQGDWRRRILWLSSREASEVLLVGLALAVMGLSLGLTGSRSGIGCLGVALLTIAAWVLRREAAGWRRVVTVGYLTCLVFATVAWTGLDSISTRFAKHGVTSEGRAELWRDAAEVARRFPLTGTGLNTYAAVTPFIKARVPVASSDEAHNDYLQLAAEGGLLVGVPGICLVCLFGREVRRRFRASQSSVTSYWLRVGAVTGLLAIALQELVEFSLQLPGNALLFTVLCTIAAHRPVEREATAA